METARRHASTKGPDTRPHAERTRAERSLGEPGSSSIIPLAPRTRPPTTPGLPSTRSSVVLVGTYPPTECGLATYTDNLCRAVAGQGRRTGVIRLIEDHPEVPSPTPVVHDWVRTTNASSSPTAMAVAAAERFEAVLLQHEFGIYPGPDGVDVVEFVERCTRPVFTVLHTVLDDPTASQHRIVEVLLRRSRVVVVHSEVAYSRLMSVHDVDPVRVAIVPHGATPNLHGAPLLSSRRPLMLTWGLLGPGKGIEYGIQAVATMRSAGLEVRYLVAGETHPNVRAREGERYRDQLVALARRCGVSDLVQFDAAYRDWDSLRALVRSATVVLLPYDSRGQVTSGVLVEALAAGKPVVATAFPHAVELSRTGAVSVVRHGSTAELAAAVERILTRPDVRGAMELAARREAEKYDWANVGRRYCELIGAELGFAAAAAGSAWVS